MALPRGRLYSWRESLANFREQYAHAREALASKAARRWASSGRLWEQFKGQTMAAGFMNNSLIYSKVQMVKPAPSQAQPLSVWEQDRSKLARHIHRLVDANPKAAKQMLAMSQEHLPEMYLISLSEPLNNLAEAVMNSDSVQILLNQNPSPLSRLLRTKDLQSLLELFP